MKRTQFNYVLPPELIAQHPLPERSGSRLLSLDGATGAMDHHRFTDFISFVRPNDLLIFNDTRVIPARLWGQKTTGGKVELLIERMTGARTALAHLRCSKSPGAGAEIKLCAMSQGEPTEHSLFVTGREGALFSLACDEGQTIPKLLNLLGHMPLPPYIARADVEEDQERYQTVYARQEGAVAAPTAGLHFTDALLREIDALGARRETVTLHVGAGTFQPVRSEEIEQHHMHKEWIDVRESVCAAVDETKRAGGRVIAVGTTVVRALESAYRAADELAPFAGDTDIFLYPGSTFHVVDALLTNFNFPESTLLMLVSAFAGQENVMRAYQKAISEEYRFFSYGDAMFMTAQTDAGARK